MRWTTRAPAASRFASRIYNNRDAEDTVQVVETGVYGLHTVNETRVRYSRLRSRQRRRRQPVSHHRGARRVYRWRPAAHALLHQPGPPRNPEHDHGHPRHSPLALGRPTARSLSERSGHPELHRHLHLLLPRYLPANVAGPAGRAHASADPRLGRRRQPVLHRRRKSARPPEPIRHRPLRCSTIGVRAPTSLSASDCATNFRRT